MGRREAEAQPQAVMFVLEARPGEKSWEELQALRCWESWEEPQVLRNAGRSFTFFSFSF